MGADFIFAIAPICENPDEAKKRINQLSHEALTEVAEVSYGESPEQDDAEGWQQVRDLISEGIDVVNTAVGRDIGLIVIDKPGTYVITGGMTWGDDPTDACRPIWALQVSGLSYE